MSDGHFETFLFKRQEAFAYGPVDMEINPFFRPGRDGLVDAQKLRVRGNHIEVEDAGRIAGADDGAGVMGDGHSFEDHPPVRLAERERTPDPFDPLGGRHSPEYNRPPSAVQYEKLGGKDQPDQDRPLQGPILLVLFIEGPAESALGWKMLSDRREETRHFLSVLLVLLRKKHPHPVSFPADDHGGENTVI